MSRSLRLVCLWCLILCTINMFSARASDAVENLPKPGTLTFGKDIAPLIYNNCAGCHHTGEVAPFPLMSFQDVQKHVKQIVRVTQSRYMPPWKAEPGYGEFHDVRRLTDDQIAVLKQWVEDGAPEGNGADAPVAPKFTDGWQLGAPDLVLKMPDAYTVPAEGRDNYRCFVIPIDIPEDKYVTAVEYRPSNRKVVHHALLYLDSNGAARKKAAQSNGVGYATFGGPGILPTGGLGGWAPGAFPRALPDGIARILKKGSDLVLQIHFHPSGKTEQEQSTIALYFAKKPAAQLLVTLPLRSRDIDIPPGEKAYKISDSFTTPLDLELIGIVPHAHLVCKDMKGTATLPDGTKKPLIWIKDWDFNWQDQYQYASPFKLPKGTKLEMEFTYDNSADNVRNPNTPPKRVTYGEQTADEMGILFLQVVPEKASDMPALRRFMAERTLRGAFAGKHPLQDIIKAIGAGAGTGTGGATDAKAGKDAAKE